MKVLAAMSGGVDSAVAAARAVAAGHDVTGVHLALSPTPAALRTGARGCCSREDAGDARRAADVLGIPFYIWDLAERFQADVIDDFVAEYAAGRTPNPCLRCNEKIKFAAVLDRALALGFDAVVTGHYARLRDGVLHALGRRRPRTSPTCSAVLDRRQLAHSIFPLGDSTKAEVRAEAAALGLAVAAKPDSHDICFIPDGDTRGFLARAARGPPGADRRQLRGRWSAGTRARSASPSASGTGWGCASRPRTGSPRYVLELRPREQHRRRRTGRRAGHRRDPRLAGRVERRSGRAVGPLDPEHPMTPADSPEPSGPFDCVVQVRAHGAAIPASVRIAGDRVHARLAIAQRGVAAGQALVMYAGDVVLGSATIVTAVPAGAIGVTDQIWAPGAATGIGSMPGTDIDEAQRLIMGELPLLPHLAELPARGAGADMIGRRPALSWLTFQSRSSLRAGD